MEVQAEPAFDDAGDSVDGSTSSLGNGGTGAVAQVAVDPQALGREIIFSANLIIGVDDVAAAGAKAAEIVAANGGLLFGQETNSQGEAQSTLTFRVRPENFQSTLDQLSGIGELRNQSVSAQDVTDRVVDLESRISTSEASLDRLRDLIANSDSVEVLASVERQLLDRETELELLRGQLRSVRDRVDLATIVVTFTSAIPRPQIALSVSDYDGHDGGVGCPASSRGGIDRGADHTICFELLNNGESPVTDLTIEDTALGLENTDFVLVAGDLSEPLQPGQSVVWAADITAESRVRFRTRVGGVPVTADGEPLAQRMVTDRYDNTIVATDDGPPSISDAFLGGWDALRTFVQWLFVVLAATIWFLWIPVALYFLIRWLNRRSATRRAQAAEEKRQQEEADRLAREAALAAAAQRTPPPPSPAAAAAAPAASPASQAPAGE